jgi:hypothetical protein
LPLAPEPRLPQPNTTTNATTRASLTAATVRTNPEKAKGRSPRR